MNKFEEMLRKQLEEYLEHGDKTFVDGVWEENLECLENSRSVKYVYETYPLWNGGLNCNGCYDYVHILRPDLPLGIEDPIDFGYEKMSKIVATVTKPYLYLATKEEIECREKKECSRNLT